MSAIQESLYRQSTVYLLLVILLMIGGISPDWAWLWMIPVAIVMYLMIVACGLVGSCLVCLVRDFQKFIPLGMTFLLFTSGIFWDVREIENTEKAEMLLALNPLAFMIDAHRQVLLHASGPDLSHLLAIAVGSGVVILLTTSYMQRFSQYLALKVLT